jgi:ribonuclease T2
MISELPHRTGTFVPVTPSGSSSNCPSTGIKYLPKSGSPAPGGTTTTTSTQTKTTGTTTTTGTATTTTTSPTSSPTGVFSGSGRIAISINHDFLLTVLGYLNAYTAGSQTGCLISAGTWYTSGTCATYTATPAGEFNQPF